MKIRIKFSKHGTVRFIGHLDIMRYFQKVMRRADVDIKYSEGFSPHQIMSFAQPLSVGLTSNGEYMDIEVNSCDSSARMLERINEVNCEGIRVLSFRELPDNVKNAMSSVAACDYSVWFKDGYIETAESGATVHFSAVSTGEDVEMKEDEFWNGLLEFMKQDKIEIIKETKKGEKLIDLKPCVHKLEIRGSVPAPCDMEVEIAPSGKTLFMQLTSGSALNIKPEQLLKAYCDNAGLQYNPFAFHFEREQVYANAGTEEAPVFKALEDYGTDI